MSLSNENGNGMVMPVGPMYGNGDAKNDYESGMIMDAINYVQNL